MNSLVNNGIVNMYPPLNDVAGCYTAQFEHVRGLSLQDSLHTDGTSRQF
jgi:hypothetical protein